MKNLRNLVFLGAIQLWSSGHAMASTPLDPNVMLLRSGGCGFPVYFPDLPQNLLGFDPKTKILPTPNLPKPQTDFVPVDTETAYTITLRAQNPNPPSCKVVAQRLKNLTAHLSEMSHLTEKMQQDQKLSFEEIGDYLAMTRKYIPQALDEIDQTVELKVTWQFLNFLPPNKKGIIYFLRNQPDNFNNFQIQGPGLKWVQEGEGIPPFFEISIDEDVSVTYPMQMLDFCFGDNTLTVRGRYYNEFGPDDPILKASWERDLLKGEQRGYWTIQSNAGI